MFDRIGLSEILFVAVFLYGLFRKYYSGKSYNEQLLEEMENKKSTESETHTDDKNNG